MKKLLEKKRANLFIIVSALIFLVVVGMVNVNVMSNKISKLNIEGKDDSKAYKVFTDEDKKTESPDVEFLAYFKGSTDTNGNAEMIDEISLNMGNSAKLYMTMNVMNEGYLKNGKISLNSKNMQFNTQINKNAFFAQAFSGVTSEIKLAQNVNSGNQHTFSGTVSKASEIYNLNDYNQVITVTFSGTFVDFDGNETSINKVVPLKIDLTGKVQSSMEYKQIEITPKVEDDSVKISFPVYSSEVLNELMLKENTVTAKIPTFNGYEPSEVVVNTSNIGSLYNSSDRTLTITKSSALKEDGSLVKALGRNNRYDIVI